MGLGAYILWQLRDRFRAGILFAIYLVYAGAERLLVEFVRRNDDAAPRPHPGPARERRDDRRRRRSGSSSSGAATARLARPDAGAEPAPAPA